MKPKIHVYLDDHVNELLTLMVKRTGATKSALVSQALDRYLSRELSDESPEHVLRRLSYIGDQLDVLEREANVLGETLSLFIRYFLSTASALPQEEAQTARALGKERYEAFVAQLGKRLAGGRSLLRDVLEELEETNS